MCRSNIIDYQAFIFNVFERITIRKQNSNTKNEKSSQNKYKTLQQQQKTIIFQK